MDTMQMMALRGAHQRNRYGVRRQPFANPFNYPPAFQVAPPAPAPERQMSLPAPTPQAGPSELERVVGGLLQLGGALAVGYIRLVVLPQMKAEVDAELKKAAREERVGDALGLLALKAFLHKATE